VPLHGIDPIFLVQQSIYTSLREGVANGCINIVVHMVVINALLKNFVTMI